MSIVVEQDLIPVVWGDVNLAIALDQRANRRDIEVWVGDDFGVVAQIYVNDGDDEPLTDFTGRTASLVIGSDCIPAGNTIVGVIDPSTGKILFDLTDVDFTRFWGRVRFIIKLAEAGRERTIAQGYIVVYGNANPQSWPNDYGILGGL